MLTIQQLLREHFESFRQRHRLSRDMSWAAVCMRDCRILGSHRIYCPRGHESRLAYNSCRHRVCPKCSTQHPTSIHWKGRGHFFGAAARAMQRILVENARRKGSLKAGGDYQRVELSEVAAEVRASAVDVLAVDEALRKLEPQDRRKAELVRMRFFAGLTMEEAARALGFSASTADNDWAYAKAWLKLEMAETD